jgi:hypothetical protein
MTEAVLALVGVVVGGLLSAATTLGVERVRERREARAAARLVHYELVQIVSQVELALHVRAVLPLTNPIPTSAWREQQPVLARTFDAQTWRALLSAYSVLSAIAAKYGEGRVDPRTPLDEEALTLVRLAIQAVKRAMGALAPLAGVPADGHARMVNLVAESEAEADEQRKH